MAAPRDITAPKQLLVEGQDAVYFFEAVRNHLGITNLQVQNFGGVSELNAFVRALAQASGFLQVDSVGIVRDAEADAHAAFQSVSGALRNARLPVPSSPGEQTDGRPGVVVLILPDATSAGMLETLCLRSVADDPAVGCLEPYFHCLAREGIPPPRNMEKARVQAFLASRDRPGMLLGQAAHAGVWPWNHLAFSQVRAFLRTL